MTQIKESQIAAFRRDNLGFVFQDFNLLDTFSLEDNIYLPLVLTGTPYAEMQRRLAPIAQQLGITELLQKFPYEVSGGQKQRAAVARALITNTSDPGRRTDRRIGFPFHRRTAVPVFCHSPIRADHRHGDPLHQAASSAGRVMFIKDGEVFHQLYRGNDTNQQFYQRISDTLTLLTTGGEVR